jgi:hypothetical protein
MGRIINRHKESQDAVNAHNTIYWARIHLAQTWNADERIKIRRATRVTLRSYGYTVDECKAEGF